MEPTILLGLKIIMTLFVSVLIPTYWITYGPQNFLWLSDIGLFLTVFGLYLESSLLISMAVIGVMPIEILWFIDYLYHLIIGNKLLGISDYMFSEKYSTFVKALSFFHVILPMVWVGLLMQWGYNRQALFYQIILTSLVLIASYLLTQPKENINWVFSSIVYNWHWMPSWLWLVILLILFPLCIIWPMHLLLRFLF